MSAYWMPVLTGALFAVPFLACVYGLERLPPPSAQDEVERMPRLPLGRAARRALVSRFGLGLGALVLFYVGLTAFRDYRDNFAAELWQALGYGDTPLVFTYSEIPVALGVLALLGLTMRVRDNRTAFFLQLAALAAGAVLVGASALLHRLDVLPGAAFMVLVGFGLYLAYVPFNCILFDRLLAAFRTPGNAGFLIYVADAAGYVGSVGLLFYKNFGEPTLSWLRFFEGAALVLLVLGLLTTAVAWVFFARRAAAAAPTAAAPVASATG